MKNVNHIVQSKRVDPFLKQIARKGSGIFLLASLMLLGGVSSANALKIFSVSGVSGKGVEVGFEARMSIAVDSLSVTLLNTSPVNSLNPDDVLGSFYFDLVGAGGSRPTLVLQSAVGDVYTGAKSGSDVLSLAGADLRADGKNGKWQFLQMTSTQSPFLGYGIGTVGNNGLSPNGFSGKMVGGSDYAIYRGEVTTQNLDDKLLVRDMASFTFTGLSGFSEKDIANSVVFGLGTAPDSLLWGRSQEPPPAVPEPSTWVLLAAGFAGLISLNRKKNKG